MPVITISRQTGSGGAEIGRQIADQLGASYLSTQIIREVAHRMGMSEVSAARYDERAEDFIERLVRVLWLTNIAYVPASDPNGPTPFESITQNFVTVTKEIVLETARTGNAVIFGHGSQFILAQQPDVLHVRFVAPFPKRVERVMQRAGISQHEAERRVREEDQRRANHIRQFYHADWHAPDPFHILLNTALLSEGACIKLVMTALEELKQNQRKEAA